MEPRLIMQVPPMAWPYVEAVITAPLPKLKGIVSFLHQASPQPDVEDLAEQCAAKERVAPELVEAVLALAINFSRLAREVREPPPGELAEAFTRGIEVSGIPGWDEKKRSAWEKREPLLRRLWVEGGAIKTMAKVRALLFDFQCVLRRSTVLTDVRHVYNDDATKIEGALILHTLSLDYMEGDSWRQMHLTLSPKDVEQLLKDLQRAQKKARVAQDLLEKAGVPELTPKRSS